MNRFEGKNVLITGASAGIGQSAVARFITEGATVVGLGRREEGLKETASLVEESTRFIPHVADMADDASIVEAARFAGEALDGRIDVLCNVAGVTLRTPIDDFDPVLAHEIMQVNCIGPLRLVNQVLPHIPAGGASVIVNIASTSGSQAVPTLAAYGASKAALVSASMTLAIELSPQRIRVVPISPSGVQTKMMWDIWQQVKDYEGDWYSRLIHPWGQDESGTPEHLAAFIAFAASEDARYWNAAELRLDGGARSAV